MAFVNQFQPVDFRTEKLKLLKVMCEMPNVNETGFRFLLPGEINAGLAVDPVTRVLTFNGEPVDPATIRVAPAAILPITNAGIQTGINKVTNAMQVAVNLFLGNTLLNATPLVVLVQGEVATPCTLSPADIVQKHDIEFEQGILSVDVQGTIGGLRLFVAVNLCVIVARETIMKANAFELFCR